MPGYFIGNYTVTDPEKYQAYVRLAMPLTIKHGGKAIIATGDATNLEGTPGSTNVTLEFPSVEAAMGWYNDPDYQAIIPMRQSATEGGSALVAPGFTMPGK